MEGRIVVIKWDGLKGVCVVVVVVMRTLVRLFPVASHWTVQTSAVLSDDGQLYEIWD